MRRNQSAIFGYDKRSTDVRHRMNVHSNIVRQKDIFEQVVDWEILMQIKATVERSLRIARGGEMYG